MNPISLKLGIWSKKDKNEPLSIRRGPTMNIIDVGLVVSESGDSHQVLLVSLHVRELGSS